LRFASGCEIHTVLALEDEIIAALNRYYRDEWLPDISEEDADSVIIEAAAAQLLTRDEAAERSAVSVLERVIARAAADGASDIHFERRPEDFHVRFRVDGTFRDIAVLPTTLAPAVVARIKVLSGMDIAEQRLPQDGRYSELVQTGKNIVTIEDPVEYALAGVNQGQTNDKAGFSFANGLRSILRQDPDVIMVGEIRDCDTLEVAMEASLTGHLVLSTLHTN